MIPTLELSQLGRSFSGGDTPWVFINNQLDVTTASGTSFSLPATSLTSGNHIFVFVRYESTTTSTSVSDTAGNTYVGLTEVIANSQVLGRWFYCLNATGNASNVVTVTWGAARTYRWVGSMQFSKSGAAFDVEASGTANSGLSVTSASFNTAAAGLLLAARSVFNADASPTFSDSMVNPFTLGTSNYGTGAYLLTGGPLTGKTITASGSANTSRALCIAAFK